MPESDGCATGLVVLALEESGMGPHDKMLERGLEWLKRHQVKDGSWRASSLNDNESTLGGVRGNGVEMDETYIGGKRRTGRRGRPTAGE